MAGFQPDGFIGGLFSGINQGQQEQQNLFENIKRGQAIDQSSVMNPLEAMLKKNEVAKSDALSRPDVLAALQQGTIGQNQSLAAKGKEDTALVDSSIQNKLGKMKAEDLQREFTTLDLELKQAQAQLAQSGNNPQAFQQLVAQYRERHANEPNTLRMIDSVANSPNPAEALKQLSTTVTTLLSQTPQLLGELQKVHATGDEHFRSAKYTADSHLAGTQYATDNKKLSGGGSGSGMMKEIQKDINNLETQATKLSLKLQDATFVAEVMSKDPSGSTLQLLQGEHNRVKATLTQKRAEQQAIMYGEQGAPAPQADPAPTKMTIGKLQELYPGIPVDKLKEAYKKKFGEDLQ